MTAPLPRPGAPAHLGRSGQTKHRTSTHWSCPACTGRPCHSRGRACGPSAGPHSSRTRHANESRLEPKHRLPRELARVEACPRHVGAHKSDAPRSLKRCIEVGQRAANAAAHLRPCRPVDSCGVQQELGVAHQRLRRGQQAAQLRAVAGRRDGACARRTDEVSPGLSACPVEQNLL